MKYRKYLGGSLFNWMYIFIHAWVGVAFGEVLLNISGIGSMKEVKYVVQKEYISSTDRYLFSATSPGKDSLKYFFPIINSKELDSLVTEQDTLTMRLYEKQEKSLSEYGVVLINKRNIKEINGKRLFLPGRKNNKKIRKIEKL